MSENKDESYSFNPEEHRQVIIEGLRETTKDVSGIVDSVQRWRGAEELKTRVLLGVGQLQLSLVLANYLKYDLPEDISTRARRLTNEYGEEAQTFITESLKRFKEQQIRK